MTIWYDATTTLRNRSRNGIANVEWQLGANLLAADPAVRTFALFDGHLRVLDAPPFIGGDTPAHDVPANLPTTWRDTVRADLHHLLGSAATPVVRALATAYRPVRALRAGAARMKTLGRRGTLATLAEQVQPGDIVVSMGADWDGHVARALHRLRDTTGCRVVTMVYDLIPLTHTHLAFHKDREHFERYYRGLLQASDLVTCISQQSQHDLLDFAEQHHLPMPRTDVLILGDCEQPPHRDPAPRGDFFLWVGTVERRKNLDLLYDALRVLEYRGDPLPTVAVVGSAGWGVDDLLTEVRLGSTAAANSLVMLGPVDDAALQGLYRRARALLFPSHYEGWGLPVREALAHGCPVAAGDNPAVRESTAGATGVTLLPTDDPEPWADYLGSVPQEGHVPYLRTWASAAADLLCLARQLLPAAHG